MYRVSSITTGLQWTAERAATPEHRDVRSYVTVPFLFIYLFFPPSLYRQLTRDVLELSENQLHVVPHVHGAEAGVGLSEGRVPISGELVGFHRHGVEGKGFVDDKIWKKKGNN